MMIVVIQIAIYFAPVVTSKNHDEIISADFSQT